MKKVLRALFALVIIGVFVLAGFGYRWWTQDPWPEPRTADPASERLLSQGQMVGFDTGHGAQGWLGIPFAEPPVDELRWRAPRKAGPWAGTFEALAPGAVCPQLGGPLSDVPQADYGDVVGDEDCLTLNVWAPRHTPAEVDNLDAPYPVMVWIHGGGNTVGYGADYDGSHLAASQGVIVVTINYRLGVLGWFNHPAVLKTAGSLEDASGNFGTLDTIAALEWVRDNIAALGGDPNRVTIFGESAGGMNVFGLLASPLAEGLFHGAISQSGLAMTDSVGSARDFRADGGHPASAREMVSRWLVEQGRAVDRASADELQASMNAEALRAFLDELDGEAMISGFDAPGGMYRAPALIADGHVLPDGSMLDALADSAVGSTVPVIAGSNRDEARLFMALDGRWVDARWGLFRAVRDPATYEAVADILSDHWRLLGVDEPLTALTRADATGTWGYRFDWDETGRAVVADMPSLMGAAHGFELPFVFGDFSGLWGIPLLFTEENEPARLALSRDMMDFWGEFARTGRPGTGGRDDLPLWQNWGIPEGTVLVFDTRADGGIRPEWERAELGDLHRRFMAVVPELDDRLACGLYAHLFWGTSSWDEANYRSLVPLCETLEPSELAPDPFSQ